MAKTNYLKKQCLTYLYRIAKGMKYKLSAHGRIHIEYTHLLKCVPVVTAHACKETILQNYAYTWLLIMAIMKTSISICA